MRIETTRILQNSFAIAWENSGSHDFSVNTNNPLIYIERPLYHTMFKLLHKPLNVSETKLVLASENIFLGRPYFAKTGLEYTGRCSLDRLSMHFMMGTYLSKL